MTIRSLVLLVLTTTAPHAQTPQTVARVDSLLTAADASAPPERRALAARNYLVSLGIPAERLRTVSYGKEFPFDPARTEEAFAKNRRAHFVVTSK